MLANDVDVDGDTLYVIWVSTPGHGSLAFSADGSFSYMPAANFNGTDFFTYIVGDGHGSVSGIMVTITVTPVNDPPVANGQSLTTAEDTPVAVTLAATDGDGDALTYAVSAGPAHGTLSGAAPDLTYTPAANYNGADSFTFTASDGTVASNIATIAITITAVNDPPIAAADAYGCMEDGGPWGPSAPGLLVNDSDPDGDTLTAALVAGPTHGSVVVGADGSFRYLPDPNFWGADSFTYRASDGQAFSNTVTVSMWVNWVNDLPVAAGQSVTTAEDTAVAVTLTATDVDGDALTYAVVAGPAHGTLSGTAPNLTYTPAANFSGPDSFTFTARDWLATSNTATVAITVTPVNDPPVANAGSDKSGAVGQVLSFSGAASSDVDGTIVSYSWDWGDDMANGVGVSPTHAYAAAGTKIVTLTVTDNDGGTATDTLVVTVVGPVNLALNKPASASSTRTGSAYAAGKAVDGSAATSWMSSKSSSSQWLRVDLGASVNISNINVFWPAIYYAKSFKVETSANGKTWTSRYSTAAGDGSLTNVTFAATSARYVRVTCTKPNNSSYYGVAELEVYQ